MSDGVTVDACVMRAFMEDFLAGVSGTARIVVETVAERMGLAVDDGGKIKHEWLTTCQNPYFREWYLAQVYQGRVRELEARIPEHHRKAISRIGMPPEGH